ncbi:MAG TPA: hypothetical protein VKX17_09280 [Planctomycetota bacterium]|nr:hypothetical protein [Planctomycetota bacterium]
MFDALQLKTIHEVNEWYEFVLDVLEREKLRVLAESLNGTLPLDSRFIDMNREEIENYFAAQLDELDFLVMFDLIAAAEAALRLDYLRRVERRLKDTVSRRFRRIDKELSAQGSDDKVTLEDHILNTWIELAPLAKRPAREFKGALKLRHWLAHGRYWEPRLARRQYAPGDVFDLSDNLLRAIIV